MANRLSRRPSRLAPDHADAASLRVTVSDSRLTLSAAVAPTRVCNNHTSTCTPATSFDEPASVVRGSQLPAESHYGASEREITELRKKKVVHFQCK